MMFSRKFRSGSECDKHGSECGKHGSECDKRGSEKERKKTVEKGQIFRKNDYLCKMKEKALTELSAPLEVEVADLLREDNID